MSKFKVVYEYKDDLVEQVFSSLDKAQDRIYDLSVADIEAELIELRAG